MMLSRSSGRLQAKMPSMCLAMPVLAVKMREVHSKGAETCLCASYSGGFSSNFLECAIRSSDPMPVGHGMASVYSHRR